MEFRLAKSEDLPKLEVMFLHIIEKMDKNNIHIWNKYYPYEEFEEDIKNQTLYLGLIKNEIVSTICLIKNYDDSEFFKWKNKSSNAIHLCRLAVNVNFQNQGIAKQTLEFAYQIAKNNNCSCLRLSVADINLPAIKFYEKNGFIKVKGYREEFLPSLNKKLREYGYEKKI